MRGLSALGALLIVFVQLSGALHLALTPHRFCPLHGIEDVHWAKAGPASQDLVIAALPGRSPSIDSPGLNEASGEVCLLASLAHERLVAVEPADSGTFCPSGGAQSVVADRDLALGPGCSLLLIAPKQGPPV